MHESDFRNGFEKLNALGQVEYHQALNEIISSSDNDDTKILRVGRLVGVALKQPFARSFDRKKPTVRTRAYREWHFAGGGPQAEFSYLKKKLEQEPNLKASWQYQTLGALLDYPWVTDELDLRFQLAHEPIAVAVAAQLESGFFGKLARAFAGYACNDPAFAQKFDETEKALQQAGTPLPLTPEALIGAGGIQLAQYMVDNVPIFSNVGPEVIAGFVIILMLYGRKKYCNWVKTFADGAGYDERQG